jgi:hypothetical protein
MALGVVASATGCGVCGRAARRPEIHAAEGQRPWTPAIGQWHSLRGRRASRTLHRAAARHFLEWPATSGKYCCYGR